MKTKSGKTASLFLAFLFIFGMFTMPTQAASYSNGIYTVNERNGINVRSGAGTNYSVVGAAANGTKFQVTRISGDWGYTSSIKCNGNKSGWVCLTYCKYQGNNKAYGSLFASTKGRGYSYQEASKCESETFTKGTMVYVWSGIVDKNNIPYSGRSCTMKLSIYNPSGKRVHSATYQKTNNNWIGYRCNVTGNWTIKVEMSDGFKGKCQSQITIKDPPAVQPTKITLNSTNISLLLNTVETKKLTATVYPSNASNKKVTWSTNNSNVATVYDGTVYPKSCGVATITAKTSNGKIATCKVVVNGISMNNFNKEVHVGDIYNLSVTTRGVSNQLKWKSSALSVLSVNSKGQITAKRAGTATITVTTGDGYSTKKTIKVLGITTKRKGSIDEGEYTTVKLNANRGNGYIKIHTWGLGTPLQISKVHVILRDKNGKEICNFDTHSERNLKLGNDHSEYQVYIMLPEYSDSPTGAVGSFINEFNKWEIECVSNTYII